MANSTARSARSRPHGFDVLRIAAATMVLVSHSYKLPTGSEPTVLHFGDGGYDWGRLGVLVFFVISGYLICGSWIADPDPARFARKRARRIYPGLVCMLLVVTFVLGPLVTTSHGYFLERKTWSFLARNLLIFPYDYVLPGVFEQHAVNGVLWTLGVEVLAYVLLGAVAVRGALRRPGLLFAFTGCLIVGGAHVLAQAFPRPGVAPVSARLELLSYFFSAACVRAVAWTPRGSHAAMAAAALVASQLFRGALGGLPLSLLLLPCATVVVVYAGTRRLDVAAPITRLGDPSYGMYIYGFVLQQVLITIGARDLSTAAFAGVSIAAALLLGYASWHLVERRFVEVAPRHVPAADPA